MATRDRRNGWDGATAAGWVEATEVRDAAHARTTHEVRQAIEQDREETRRTTTREEVEAEFEAARTAWEDEQTDENAQRFATAAQRRRAWTE